jgi:NADPH-dependent glutamate synthase beta subunit-like oxidoreductase
MTENRDAKPPAKTDGGAAEVQARTDEELEQGFRGTEVDTTPNENYTVAGVTAGKPTPETDDDHAEKVRRDLLGVERGATGVAER